MEREIETTGIDTLFERVSQIIEQARTAVARTVNTAEVYTKYEIGRYIVENEQQGQYRAQYGKQVLKELSEKLTKKYGDGWSVETLKLCRRFFVVYSDSVTSGYPIYNKKQNRILELGKHCLPNSHNEQTGQGI